MKKIFFFSTIFLLFATSCHLKQYVVNDNIKVKMPAGATVIPNSELAGVNKAFQIADKVYNYDGMLVVFTQNEDENLKGVSLDKYKATRLYYLKNVSTNISADIKTDSGNKFLVINSDKELDGKSIGEYMFNSDPETGKSIIVGYIHYDRGTQQQKAQKLLKTILENIETN